VLSTPVVVNSQTFVIQVAGERNNEIRTLDVTLFVLAVGGLVCARLLTTNQRGPALSAAAAMALALGLVGTDAGAWVAGLVAIGLGAIGADDGLEATA